MNSQNKNHYKFGKKEIVFSALIVVVLGIIVVIHRVAPSTANETAAIQASVEDGVQNLTTTVTAGRYPNIAVQKGVPVVWNIKADSSVLTSCNDTLVISEYDIKVNLKTGDNIIKFTPTKSGTIKYSCQMGMVTGQIDVVNYPQWIDGKRNV